MTNKELEINRKKLFIIIKHTLKLNQNVGLTPNQTALICRGLSYLRSKELTKKDVLNYRRLLANSGLQTMPSWEESIPK